MKSRETLPLFYFSLIHFSWIVFNTALLHVVISQLTPDLWFSIISPLWIMFAGLPHMLKCSFLYLFWIYCGQYSLSRPSKVESKFNYHQWFPSLEMLISIMTKYWTFGLLSNIQHLMIVTEQVRQTRFGSPSLVIFCSLVALTSFRWHVNLLEGAKVVVVNLKCILLVHKHQIFILKHQITEHCIKLLSLLVLY